MKKSQEELNTYRELRQKLERELNTYKEMTKSVEGELFLLGILEKGAVIGNEGELLTESREVFKELLSHYQSETNAAWKEADDWSVKQMFPERHKKQEEMLKTGFVPYLDKEQRVGDLACANGEWSFYIAEHAGWVDGFEYSEHMVKTPNEKIDRGGVRNVSFMQADACRMQFEHSYDNFMMMGLLTYIYDEEDAETIVDKVAGAIKNNGHLVTKDTLNVLGEDVMYVYNTGSRYTAVYWSWEKYYGWFIKSGFKLEREYVLDEVEINGMNFVSRGAIWVKCGS